MHSHIKATLAGAVSAVAMFSFGSAAHCRRPPDSLRSTALIRGCQGRGVEVTIIHPLFSDRTVTASWVRSVRRSAMALGDDFQFNSLRKGTGATVAQVRQEIQADKFTVDLILVSAHRASLQQRQSVARSPNSTAATGKTASS